MFVDTNDNGDLSSDSRGAEFADKRPVQRLSGLANQFLLTHKAGEHTLGKHQHIHLVCFRLLNQRKNCFSVLFPLRTHRELCSCYFQIGHEETFSS